MNKDNPEDNVLDTTIRAPSMTVSEIDMLLFAIDRSRAQFAWKCGELDAAALSRRFPPSGMTLGGLVKHLALIEEYSRHVGHADLLREAIDGRTGDNPPQP
jgi:hypothetical protein